MDFENLRIFTVDLETSVKNLEVGKNKASPFYEGNDIVLGLARNEAKAFGMGMDKAETQNTLRDLLVSADILVGHNIKFDANYINRYVPTSWRTFLRRGGRVWDTQIVHYLLSGQTSLFPKLDEVSKLHGGTVKDDRIKAYWDEGIDTEDINTDELLSYLISDVSNTELIFWNQLQEVLEKGMLPLVLSQMEALIALVEMESNGIQVDRETMEELERECASDLCANRRLLVDVMETRLPEDMKADTNPSSAKQVSAFLFGGEIETVTVQTMLDDEGKPVLFKSGLKKGKERTRKEKVMVEVPPHPDLAFSGTMPYPMPPKNLNDVYSVNDAELKKLKVYLETTAPLGEGLLLKGFINTLLDYRTLSKDYNTYYVGIGKLIFPDGKLHPNFNQCGTSTGRLTSTQPNAQNFTSAEE